MKITPKKVKKILLVASVILIAAYACEYYCTTRPVGQCTSFICKDETSVLGTFRDQTLFVHTCLPRYREFWK